MNTPILTASHYGVVHFGDLDCEAVVLTTGERGYIQRQLASALGLREKSPSTQIGALIKEFAAKSLSAFEKKGYAKVRLPSGQTGTFFRPESSVMWRSGSLMPRCLGICIPSVSASFPTAERFCRHWPPQVKSR